MLNESEYFGQQKLFHGEVPAVLGSKLGALLCDVEESISGQFWGRLCSICDEVEAHLNGGNPQSELGRFNSGKMLAHSEVSDCLAAAVDLSKEYLRKFCQRLSPAPHTVSPQRNGNNFGLCQSGELCLPGSWLSPLRRRLEDKPVESLQPYAHRGCSA